MGKCTTVVHTPVTTTQTKKVEGRGNLGILHGCRVFENIGKTLLLRYFDDNNGDVNYYWVFEG